MQINQDITSAGLRSLFNPFRAEPENGIPGVWVQLHLGVEKQFACELNLGQEWRLRMADELFNHLQDKQIGFHVDY